MVVSRLYDTSMPFTRRLHQAVPTKTSIDTLNFWRGPQQLDNYVATHPEFAPLAKYPIASWIGDWIANPQQTVSGYASQAGTKTLLLAVYAIPNRDTGGYSSGGFADQASYLNWVTSIKNGAGSKSVWYVLEPDALGLASNLSNSAKAERLDTLSKAVAILKSGPNAKAYIDCSHWLAPSTAADLLISANIAACEGFTLNVSNFESNASMASFGESVLVQLVNRGVAGKKYIIDTSRNGNGPLTSAFGTAASPWLNAQKEWCNPPGRGAGLSPRTPSDRPNCAAYLYIKMVGESDGNDPGSTFFSNYYGENAPAAGSFWLKWLQDFMANTNQSNFQ